MSKRTSIVAPHLDDETLACGGTIVHEVKAGSDVSVIYMTDSSKSHLIDLGISKDPTPDEVAAVRKEEVFAATRELGILPGNLTFLDFPDGELRKHIARARRRVTKILSANWPDEIYIPFRGDKHADHIAANEIALCAINAIGRPITVYEYITWVCRPIAQIDIQGEPGGESADQAEEIRHNISDSLPAKNAAIDRYKSQTTLYWPSQVSPVLDEEFLRPFRENPFEFFKRYKC